MVDKPIGETSKNEGRVEIDLDEVNKLKDGATYDFKVNNVSNKIKNLGKPKTGTDATQYVAYLSDGGFSYTGRLDNKKFSRNGIGLNIYKNHDKYLGQWNLGNKHDFGQYHHNKKNPSDDDQIYLGKWTNNVREGHGIYVWHTSGTQISDAVFDAFVGDFQNDKFEQGAYLSKPDANSYFCYFGKFDSEGRKTDKNCFFFQAKEDRLFHGEIFQDKFVRGHVMTFDQKDYKKVVNICSFEMKDDKPIIKEFEITDKSVQSEIATCSKFILNFVSQIEFTIPKKNMKADIFTAVFNLFQIANDKIFNLVKEKEKLENYDDEKILDLLDYSVFYDQIVRRYHTEILQTLGIKDNH